MKTEFDHAANNSPRSGGDKKVTPAVAAVVLIVSVALAIWLKMHG